MLCPRRGRAGRRSLDRRGRRRRGGLLGHEGRNRRVRESVGPTRAARPGRSRDDVLARVRQSRQGSHAGSLVALPQIRGARPADPVDDGRSRELGDGHIRPRVGETGLGAGVGVRLPRPEFWLAGRRTGPPGRWSFARDVLCRGNRADRPARTSGSACRRTRSIGSLRWRACRRRCRPGWTCRTSTCRRTSGPIRVTAFTLNGALPEDPLECAADRRYRAGQFGAAGGVAGGRGLSRMYNWLLDGFTAQTVEDILRPETEGPDLVVSSPAMVIEQVFGRGFEAAPPAGASAGAAHVRTWRCGWHYGLRRSGPPTGLRICDDTRGLGSTGFRRASHRPRGCGLPSPGLSPSHPDRGSSSQTDRKDLWQLQ